MVDEVVGRGIIEVVGDATQFSAAMAQVAQAAGLVETKLVDTATSIGTTFKQAEEATTSATTKIDGSTKRFIASVEREIATLSMSRDSYRAWEAQVKGIPESVYGPYIAKLNEAKAAQEQAAKALKDQAAAELQLAAAKRDSDRATASQEQFLANLREQVALYGRTTDEVLEYRAAQAGVLAQATPMISQLRAQRAAQEQAAQAAKDEAQAQREVAAAKAGRDNFLNSLKAQADAVGKTRSQILELQAAQMGLTSQAAPYIAKLREQEGALIRGGKAYNEYGQTIKQTNAALRQVPAQITDIVVSLQGGTAPLTVLLQQGGQLRDVFGGIVPAAKALGSAVIGLINPYTLAAAAAAALVYGYYKGTAETDRFRNALILTGNVAGTTAAGLDTYARSIAATGLSQSAAADALVAFINTNKVATENLERFATTAVLAQRATSKAVADTVKEYAELGKEPVEASRRLNEQYNYLTFAVYEQIKALKLQGREVEAVALAQKAFDEQLSSRSKTILKNLGDIERGWFAVKDMIDRATNAVANFGRPAQKLAQAQEALMNVAQRVVDMRAGRTFATAGGLANAEAELKAAGQRVYALQSSIRAEEDLAKAQGERQRGENAAIAAGDRLDKIYESHGSKTKRLGDALRQLAKDLDVVRSKNPFDPRLDPAAISAAAQGLKDSILGKDERAARPKAYTDDAATRRLQQLRETEASLRLELSTTEKLVGAQRDLAEFNQLIADLKEKKILTAEQKSLLAAQDQIRAQLQYNVALQRRLDLRDEETKEMERQKKLMEDFLDRSKQIQDAVAEAAKSRREQYDDRLGVFGKGSEAREQLASQTAIRRQFERFQLQLRNAAKEGIVDSKEYAERTAAIKESLQQAEQDNKAYYEAIKRNQADWQNGSSEALQNYLDGTKNVAASIEEVFTSAFKGAEDALLQFVRTGKLDFKSLADSIITDLVRIAIQQQITKPFAEYMQTGIGSGSGFGGMIGSALSAFFGSGMNIDTGGIGITSGGSDLSSSGAAIFARRAIGGPVSPGRAYEVAENGPELLNWQGRQFLLPGNGMGTVESKPQGAAPPMSVTNQFYISGPVDRRTQTQLAAEAGRGVQRALARNN